MASLPSANRYGFPVGYILPTLALGIFSGAAMIRLIRSSLLEVPDGKDIKLARIKRCLRNTLISAPVLFGGFLAGIVVIEPVFGLYGIGELGIDAMRTRDLPLLQAIILLNAAMVIGFKLAVHILVLLVDVMVLRLEARGTVVSDSDIPVVPIEIDPADRSTEFSSNIRNISSPMPRWRMPWVALIALGILALVAIFAPTITPHDPVAGSLEDRLAPPFSEFLLGTDKQGRDILSRLIYGARIGLITALITLLPVGLVGGTLGIVSGLSGGRVDTLIMWGVDAALAFPNIFFALLLASVIGPGWLTVLLAVTLILWPKFARATRDEVMAVKTNGGLNRPNLLNAFVALLTLHIGLAILIEATLSFFGVGMLRPTPSWGLMVADGKNIMISAWWVFTFSSLALTVVSVGLIASSFRWSKI